LLALVPAVFAAPAPAHDGGTPAGARPPHDCPAGIKGAWSGTLAVSRLFDAHVILFESGPGEFRAQIRTQRGTEDLVAWEEGPYLRFQSARLPLSFRGRLSAGRERLDGFVQQGSSLVRVSWPSVPSTEGNAWSSDWTLLGAPDDELRFDLYVEEDDAGGIGGYFFFRDQRLPGLAGHGLRCEGDTLRLGEKILGLEFHGTYDRENDRLLLDVEGPAGSSRIRFDRMPPDEVPSIPDAPSAPPRAEGTRGWSERVPEAIDDGWATSAPSAEGLDPRVLAALVDSVTAGALEYTHSVLVARNGRLVLEEYFYGFDRQTRHDMRSASKTVTSTLVGLAIKEGRISDSGARALDYLPQYRWYDNWDDRKSEIRVGHLLSMSSGLDARDWEPESVASEVAYQTQTGQPDWVKYALDAPMLWDPGTHVYYGGANPLILGGVLDGALEEPVEWFADRTLFQPLGISDYRFFLDPLGTPYMGGGMFMRPRDMLKYGQLYLEGGTWQGRRVLSADWVGESWQVYGRLAPMDRNGHEYGYLWWHHAYEIDGTTIRTLEARGNGGQYIFVVPDLDMVAVITSGNFRNGRLRQPEEIVRRWLLPAALQEER
jgi:CubicO group peptidase (beta-lactamase class C family)